MKHAFVILSVLGVLLLCLLGFSTLKRGQPSLESPQQTSTEPATEFRFYTEQLRINESKFENLSLPVSTDTDSKLGTIRLSFPAYLRQASTSKKGETVFLLISGRKSDMTWKTVLEQSAKTAILDNNLVEESPTIALLDFPILTADTLPSVKNRVTSVLREINPDFTLKNWIIGVADLHSCDGASLDTISSFVKQEPVKSVLIYDGCYGDILTPSSLLIPSGVDLIFGTFTNASGVGGEQPRNIPSPLSRAEHLHLQWQLGASPENIIRDCAQNIPTAVIHSTQQGIQKRGRGVRLGITLSQDNTTNVRAMTNIAFCALYANNR